MNAAVKNNNQYMIKIVHDLDAESPRDWDNLGKMICWHSRYNLGDKHDFDNSNDFLRQLVGETLKPKEIIAYVKEGNADGVTMEYDKSAHEWNLNSYSDFLKKWYTEYTTEAPLNMNDDVLSDTILNELQTEDLFALAERNNCIMPLNFYDHSVQSISTKSFYGHAHHADWDSGVVGWVYASHEDIAKEYGDASPGNIEKAKALITSEVETYDKYIQGQCYGFKLYENGTETDSCWGFIGDFDEAKKSIREYIPDEAAELLDDMEYGDKAMENDDGEIEDEGEDEMEEG